MSDKIRLQKVCDFYGMGSIVDLRSLDGGRSHYVCKVKTDLGEFVIKQLLTHHKQPLNLDLFRNTAAISLVVYEYGLPVVTPFIKNNDVIFEKGACAYMVYPFSDARVLQRSDMTLSQCAHVATFLVRVHNLNLTVPAAPVWSYAYNEADWTSAYDYFRDRPNFSIAPLLERLNKKIRTCFTKYIELKTAIVEDTVVSHRDIDSYNILWISSDEYVVIDWDLAGQIDAAQELMYVAIGFARESNKHFNFEKFKEIIASYAALRPIKTTDGRPLLYAVLSNWLTWSQQQLHKVMLKEYDLAALNVIVVDVRRSLLAVEYMLSIENKVLKSWDEALSNPR